MASNFLKKGKQIKNMYYRMSPLTTVFLTTRLFNRRLISKQSLRCQEKQKHTVVRPLLILSRHDVKKLCQFWKLPIYPDLTNEKLNFSRNKIRKQLLPALKSIFNPQIDNALSQCSEILLTDRLYIDAVLCKLNQSDHSIFNWDPPISVKIRGKPLAPVPSILKAAPLSIRREIAARFVNKNLSTPPYPSLTAYPVTPNPFYFTPYPLLIRFNPLCKGLGVRGVLVKGIKGGKGYRGKGLGCNKVSFSQIEKLLGWAYRYSLEKRILMKREASINRFFLDNPFFGKEDRGPVSMVQLYKVRFFQYYSYAFERVFTDLPFFNWGIKKVRKKAQILNFCVDNFCCFLKKSKPLPIFSTFPVLYLFFSSKVENSTQLFLTPSPNISSKERVIVSRFLLSSKRLLKKSKTGEGQTPRYLFFPKLGTLVTAC